MVLGVFLNPQRARKEKTWGGCQRFREHFGFMCFSQGGGQQGSQTTTQTLLHHMDAIFLSSKVFLNDFETSLKTFRSHSLVWAMCVSWLSLCHRTSSLISHFVRQIFAHWAPQQLFISCHSNSDAVAVVTECLAGFACTFLFVFS